MEFPEEDRVSKEDQASVKRVRPYPIDATLTVNTESKKISIILINTLGVIARTPGLMLKVGTELGLEVDLPVLGYVIKNTVKVRKTYDRAAQPAGIERMAELHFTHLPSDVAKQIAQFMAHIGQKP